MGNKNRFMTLDECIDTCNAEVSRKAFFLVELTRRGILSCIYILRLFLQGQDSAMKIKLQGHVRDIFQGFIMMKKRDFARNSSMVAVKETKTTLNQLMNARMLVRPSCREDQNSAMKTKLSVLVKQNCQDFTMTIEVEHVRVSSMEDVVEIRTILEQSWNVRKLVMLRNVFSFNPTRDPSLALIAE